MKLALKVEVQNGTGMPSVNTFGGCDPFLEIRCMKGDPAKTKGFLEQTPKDSKKTKARDGDLNPIWNETLTLSKVTHGGDYYINLILWDSGLSKHTPIGYRAYQSTEMLEDLQYDPQADEMPKRDLKADNFTSFLPDSKAMGLKCEVNLSYSYLEVHKFKVSVQKCGHLPKVDTIGSIDAFVEVRLVKGDPRQMEYKNAPGSETLWSGKTQVVNDNMEPTFNEEMAFERAADPSLFLIVCVADSATLGNTPIGMVVVPFRQICSNKGGAVQEFKKTKLEKLPNWPAPENLKLASVTFSVVHEVCFDNL